MAPTEVPPLGVGGVGQLLGWRVRLRASGQVHGWPAPGRPASRPVLQGSWPALPKGPFTCALLQWGQLGWTWKSFGDPRHPSPELSTLKMTVRMRPGAVGGGSARHGVAAVCWEPPCDLHVPCPAQGPGLRAWQPCTHRSALTDTNTGVRRPFLGTPSIYHANHPTNHRHPPERRLRGQDPMIPAWSLPGGEGRGTFSDARV